MRVHVRIRVVRVQVLCVRDLVRKPVTGQVRLILVLLYGISGQLLRAQTCQCPPDDVLSILRRFSVVPRRDSIDVIMVRPKPRSDGKNIERIVIRLVLPLLVEPGAALADGVRIRWQAGLERGWGTGTFPARLS